MTSRDTLQRSSLPIPDAQAHGLTTFDAKDPGTKFPPIRDLRPPAGAPNENAKPRDQIDSNELEEQCHE